MKALNDDLIRNKTQDILRLSQALSSSRFLSSGLTKLLGIAREGSEKKMKTKG